MALLHALEWLVSVRIWAIFVRKRTVKCCDVHDARIVFTVSGIGMFPEVR
jgi:hypothetical protein